MSQVAYNSGRGGGRGAKTTFISKSIIQIKLGRAGSRSAVVVVSITICHTKRRYWSHLSYSSVQCTPPEGTYFVSLDSKGNLYRSNWKTLKWRERPSGFGCIMFESWANSLQLFIKRSDNNFFFLWRDHFLGSRKMLKCDFFKQNLIFLYVVYM